MKRQQLYLNQVLNQMGMLKGVSCPTAEFGARGKTPLSPVPCSPPAGAPRGGKDGSQGWFLGPEIQLAPFESLLV